MAQERVERRLAAILAADVVGYSRLMGENEAGTLAALKDHQAQFIDPTIAEHRGRIVKLMGDGVLVEFASVVAAVACAAAIQRGMAERNRDVPEARRILFRIGVNSGDVIIDGDDIHGDGVNVAARLEGLAEPGGICIPRKVFHEVRNKLDVGYAFIGEQTVKNIETAIPAYRVMLEPDAAGQVIGEGRPSWPRWQLGAVAAGAVALIAVAVTAVWWQPWVERVEPASVERMAFPLPDKPSIAVLPFDNLSGDPEQDFWIDGTTDAVITALSKTPNLFVIARNSTFAHKGKPVKVHEIAQEFGVRYVLMGSIQRADNRVRVNARLFDALSGHNVWAEQFDRELDDLFALQDDLTREVVTALEVELTEGEQARIWRRQTGSQRAYELFRKALVLYRRRTKADNQAARKLFTEAAATDPGFADANCLVGYTHFRAGINGWDRPRGEAFGKGREWAEQAIALDPDYPHAYALLGAIATWEDNIEEAIAQYQKSLSLEPNYSGNVAGYAHALVFASRGAEAVEQIERAMRLSPYYPTYYLLVAGNAYRLVGRMGDALAAYEKRVERAPKSFFAKLGLAGLYVELGRQADGEAMMAKALRLAPWLTQKFVARFLPYKAAAEREAVIDSMRKAGLPENPPLKLPDKPSIAVLPFTNMSGDAEQEYFADGMTEDIITDLSKISGLFVIARNSSFQYKGKSPNLREVGRELGVKFVLEGSVRRAGDRVRINAQLVDATNGGHLWAERYDGELTDVFALQDKVTEQIVAALAVKLTAGEGRRLAKEETDNPRAYDAFLQGWEHYRRWNIDSFGKAVPFFKKAIELDPDYGRAHAALASIYWQSWRHGERGSAIDWPESMGVKVYFEALDIAKNHLDLAMARPTSLAHQVNASMRLRRRRYGEAIAEAERAVALDPNDPDGYAQLAYVLTFGGRPNEAVPMMRKAMRLDPHYPSNYLGILGIVRFALGDLEEAASLLERRYARNPEDQSLVPFQIAANVLLGRDAIAGELFSNYDGYTSSIWFHYMRWPFKDIAVFERYGRGMVKAGTCCLAELEEQLKELREKEGKLE